MLVVQTKYLVNNITVLRNGEIKVKRYSKVLDNNILSMYVKYIYSILENAWKIIGLILKQ